MNAVITMQPLTVQRKPLFRPRIVGTVPRDGQPHRVGGVWEIAHLPEMPHYVRVRADDGVAHDFEVDCAGPVHMRHLGSVTFYQMLTVLPKRAA